jgi:hypothetical protein
MSYTINAKRVGSQTSSKVCGISSPNARCTIIPLKEVRLPFYRKEHGDDVHELSSSDFIGAWIASCLEKGSETSVRALLSMAVTGREEGYNGK